MTTPTGPAQEPSDTEMLDWIETHPCDHKYMPVSKFWWLDCPGYIEGHAAGNTLRKAVIDAMLAENHRLEPQRPPATAKGDKL